MQKIGIIHRDVQPENIFLTRGATVKLGHFSQSKALFEEVNDEDNELLRELGQCKTPVGREEFMCIEKVFLSFNCKLLKLGCFIMNFPLITRWCFNHHILVLVIGDIEILGQKCTESKFFNILDLIS